jgi:hypothetical protein
MEKCSVETIPGTMLKLYLTPVRIVTTMKNTKNKYWKECRDKGSLIHCWWEYKLV